MKKRIVAVMLTAIMAVVPMAAYASETETETAAAETEGASEAESETEKKVDLTGLTIGVQLGTTGDLSVTDEYGDRSFRGLPHGLRSCTHSHARQRLPQRPSRRSSGLQNARRPHR